MQLGLREQRPRGGQEAVEGTGVGLETLMNLAEAFELQLQDMRSHLETISREGQDAICVLKG